VISHSGQYEDLPIGIGRMMNSKRMGKKIQGKWISKVRISRSESPLERLDSEIKSKKIYPWKSSEMKPQEYNTLFIGLGQARAP
jgi:hypothetical protein